MADAWESLADPFVNGAYATVKGKVRTYVIHEQMRRHLPPPPATVLDVGGGAGHQSFPLARLGYDVTLIDPSPAMLEQARDRLGVEALEVRARVHLIRATGEEAATATGGRLFDAVLCHGVVMYAEDPGPLVSALAARTSPGGVVSIGALNADAMAVRPALERRFADALDAFDATVEQGVLGVPTRADTVEGLTSILHASGIEAEQWYGVWLFSDWLDLAGVPVPDSEQRAVARVELEASRRDPYRRISRLFHLVGRRPANNLLG